MGIHSVEVSRSNSKNCCGFSLRQLNCCIADLMRGTTGGKFIWKKFKKELHFRPLSCFIICMFMGIQMQQEVVVEHNCWWFDWFVHASKALCLTLYCQHKSVFFFFFFYNLLFKLILILCFGIRAQSEISKWNNWIETIKNNERNKINMWDWKSMHSEFLLFVQAILFWLNYQ